MLSAWRPPGHGWRVLCSRVLSSTIANRVQLSAFRFPRYPSITQAELAIIHLSHNKVHVLYILGSTTDRRASTIPYIFTRDRFNDGQASERRSATRRTRHGGAVGRLYLGPRDLDARRLSGQSACRPQAHHALCDHAASSHHLHAHFLHPALCTPATVKWHCSPMPLDGSEGKTCHSLCHSSVVVPFRKGLRRVQLRHEMPLMRSLACEPSKKMLLALFATTPVAEARPA